MIDSARIPMAARLGVLLACTVLAAMQQAQAAPTVPISQAVLPGLILLLIALIATLPMPPSVPPGLLPLAEAFASAVLLGALGERGQPYLPYLLVPIMIAGLAGGFRYALAAAALTAVGMLGAAAAAADSHQVYPVIKQVTDSLPSMVAIALLSATIRRARENVAKAPADPAYRDAHRLLIELQAVSRQLSLGLDPPTLSAALLEELSGLATIRSGTVLARTDGGIFVPLAGTEPSAEVEQAAGERWDGAPPPDTFSGGVIALPVRMGDRTVALVALDLGPDGADQKTAAAVKAAVDAAGPRLASALLFDDVRRLATVDERNRVAREIHDGIAQDLASLGYLVDDIKRDADPPTAERLTTLAHHVRTMVSELRLRIFDLRATVSDSVGLGTAVSEYVKRVGTQAGLEVNVSLAEAPRRLPVTVEVELLRILQEAVTNVRRHAHAHCLSVGLTVDPPRARLTVCDDGRGLGQARPDSMGITGMRERARRIGATLHVGPGTTSGTCVTVALEAPVATVAPAEGDDGEDDAPAIGHQREDASR